MGDYFIGEIRLFPYQKIPQGWLQCIGQVLNIQQNAALFALLGNHFGGDGKTTFALPDLRGRAIVGLGNPQYAEMLGKSAGSDAVQLTTSQMPLHSHPVNATSAPATATLPTGGYFAAPQSQPPIINPPPGDIYTAPSATALNLVSLYPGAVATTGGGQAHENRQPFLVLTYCIAIEGIFPPRD